MQRYFLTFYYYVKFHFFLRLIKRRRRLQRFKKKVRPRLKSSSDLSNGPTI
jgi:hypothetical protein